MTVTKENLFSYKYPHPAVTTDVVVFTISKDKLKLLLIRRGLDPYKGSWALPGGFLNLEEDLEECAIRELQEETGLNDMYLEQLHTFGRPGRDPRERVISVAYYAIAPDANIAPVAASDATDAAWFPVDQLPALAFDHSEIISMAHKRLISKLDYSAIACRFLPGTFTLSELQKIYESIRNNQMDKRNFRKNIIGSGFIETTGETRREGKHRPAQLYRVAEHTG